MKQNDCKPIRSTTTCQLQQTTMDQNYGFPTKKLGHLQAGHQNQQQHCGVPQCLELMCEWTVWIVSKLLNQAPG